MDDEQFFDDRHDARDEELDSALEVLKSLPQSRVAYEIGMNERRLRDIEHGRSKPRARTRDAILRLADEIREGRMSNGLPEASRQPWRSAVDHESGGQAGQPGFGPLIAVACFVVFMIVKVVIDAHSQE